jgi:hypothetical protein
MENALISLFCIALFLVGTLNLTLTSFSLVEKVSGSWCEVEEQRRDIRQTGITTVNATAPQDDQVEITVRNNGAVSLADFERWDIIVRYQDGKAMWLPYTTNGTSPSWTLDGIYFGSHPEVFEPNILNAGEEMLLILDLAPPLSENSTGEATISTPRGIVARAMFTKE